MIRLGIFDKFSVNSPDESVLRVLAWAGGVSFLESYAFLLSAEV